MQGNWDLARCQNTDKTVELFWRTEPVRKSEGTALVLPEAVYQCKMQKHEERNQLQDSMRLEVRILANTWRKFGTTSGIVHR